MGLYSVRVADPPGSGLGGPVSSPKNSGKEPDGVPHAAPFHKPKNSGRGPDGVPHAGPFHGPNLVKKINQDTGAARTSSFHGSELEEVRDAWSTYA